jgi:hypothetical protein
MGFSFSWNGHLPLAAENLACIKSVCGFTSPKPGEQGTWPARSTHCILMDYPGLAHALGEVETMDRKQPNVPFMISLL